MNVACGACPAKYVIPDEKVRGRKVRIPCKRCGAAIIIDGTRLASDKEDPAPRLEPSPVRTDAPRGTASPGSSSSQTATSSRDIGSQAPMQVVRPQRAIRQTIIGVAP